MKKTGISMSLWLIMGIVLLVLILIPVSHLFASELGTLTEQAYTKSYNNFINTTKSLVKSNQKFASAAIPLNLDSGSSIVGFNKEEYVKDACHPPEQVQKPAVCGRHACLCYYNPGYYEDFKNNKIGKHSCVQFPEVDYFISYYYADYYYEAFEYDNYGKGKKAVKSYYGVNDNIIKNMVGDYIGNWIQPASYPNDYYSYFFIYGQCDGWTYDENFGNNIMYIEKYKDKNNKTYVFIAKNTDKIKKRAEIISKTWLNKTSTV